MQELPIGFKQWLCELAQRQLPIDYVDSCTDVQKSLLFNAMLALTDTYSFEFNNKGITIHEIKIGYLFHYCAYREYGGKQQALQAALKYIWESGQ